MARATLLRFISRGLLSTDRRTHVIAIGADRFRSRAAASPETGAGGGGTMNDFSKRFGEVEKVVAEVRTRLDATLPHLATKADLHSMKADMHSTLHSMEVRMITWMIATSFSSAASAFAIAKYFH
jgi:hypothetical protein